MDKEKEVLVSTIVKEQGHTKYEMKKYAGPQNIAYSDDHTHRKMHNHAKRLLAFVSASSTEHDPQSVSFLDDYNIN
jgi:hypothetical protein